MIFIVLIVILCIKINWSTKKEEENYETNHALNSFALGITISLLILICFFSYIMNVFEFHYLPEPSVCLICGMLVGVALRYGSHYVIDETNKPRTYTLNATNDTVPEYLWLKNNNKIYEYAYKGEKSESTQHKDILSSKVLFNPEIFFYLILPPIIFNCGFKMKKIYFFRNFGTILTMALIGTALTMFLFSTLIYIYSFIDTSVKILGLNFAQSLVFGVIVCSTDPGTLSILSVFTQLGVDVDLYYIILGESALNDAVSLIAQRTVNNYHHQYVENNIPYSASNIFKYLGLFFLTLIGSFTVGTMFALLNAVITKSTQLHRFPIVEAALFLILSYCSFIATEMCGMVGIVGILFCGVFQAHYTRTNLSDESKLFFSLMISRAVTVYLLCFILNIKRRRKIKIEFQHIMFFAGLKGAISFALAFEDTSTEIRQLMLTCTVVLVLITVLLFGGSIAKLVSYLKISCTNHRIEKIPDTAGTEDNFEVDNLYSDESWIARKWHHIDESFITPFFTNLGPSYKMIFKRIVIKLCPCFFSSTDFEIFKPIMVFYYAIIIYRIYQLNYLIDPLTKPIYIFQIIKILCMAPAKPLSKTV
ncbi:hypothetical protein HZS_6401, partial [Henneguya salminicola]